MDDPQNGESPAWHEWPTRILLSTIAAGTLIFGITIVSGLVDESSPGPTLVDVIVTVAGAISLIVSLGVALLRWQAQQQRRLIDELEETEADLLTGLRSELLLVVQGADDAI